MHASLLGFLTCSTIAFFPTTAEMQSITFESTNSCIVGSTSTASQNIETVSPPISIARTYLQPLGMPVVDLFHKIRENPFLNFHRTNASGLESLGDFFLIPSRYLFGGQDINDQFQSKHSFQYNELGWIKTPLSLVTFPVGDVIGYTLKKLAMCNKTRRKEYRKMIKHLNQNAIVAHQPLYHSLGIMQLQSEESTTCLHQSRPSILSSTHQLEIAAFAQLAKLFDQHNIIYWLDCGTCLGVYRYGGMIPWDDDIDIAIMSPDHENVKNLLKTLDPNEFQIQDWSSYRYPKTFLKLYIKKTKTLIDIYHYDLDALKQEATYIYSYRDSALPQKWKQLEEVMTKPVSYAKLFPLKRARLDGVDTWVPNDIEAFLQLKYGNDLSPTMIWDENSQSYLKVKDHPYWKMADN